MDKRVKITANEEEWLRAAAMGSIWAAFEVMFGYFFHNLRLPFAGSFLTFWGIVLLSSFAVRWPGKRLFVKAAVICALIRSMTPTSVILGPMIGILLEGAIFQMVINGLGRNLWSFVFAGIFSMYAAIIHKVASILIIYGFDVINVLENFYIFLQKMSGISLPLNTLILLVLAVYAILGITSGVIGYKLGLSVRTENLPDEVSWQMQASLFDLSGFRYHTGWLFYHVIALIIIMGMMYYRYFHFSILFSILYVVSVYFRYGKRLRRILKLVFWFQLFLVFILTLFFWGGVGAVSGIHMENFVVAFRIVMRALVLVTAFSGLAIELKNPIVKVFLVSRGAAGLYYTVDMAVSILPYISKNITDKRILWNPLEVYKKALGLSDQIFESFKRKYLETGVVFIITGGRHAGKTTFLQSVIGLLNRDGICTCGVLSEGFDEGGERAGFYLVDLRSLEKILLCDKNKSGNDFKVGRFYFKKQAVELGQRVLKRCLDRDCVVVVDEIGPAELKGKGWFEVLDARWSKPGKPMIWTVRKRMLERVMSTFTGFNYVVCDVETCTPEEMVRKLLEKVSLQKK